MTIELLITADDRTGALETVGAPNRRSASPDVAVPLCETEEDGLTVVTKGGGIGEEDTMSRLLRRATA